MSKTLHAAACVIALAVVPGCYHSRVIVPEQPATDAQTKTVNSFFWGMLQENVQPSNCGSRTLQEVRVDWNFGYALMTVVTLGIWSPMTVQWQCAKTPAPPF